MTQIKRLHQRLRRHYRDDTPKDDTITAPTNPVTASPFPTVTPVATSTPMTTYLTTPLPANLGPWIVAPPTLTPTGTAAPTSELWAITVDEHSPGGDLNPSRRIPPGFNYDAGGLIDAVAKYLAPLAGYPATTKNIADAWNGRGVLRVLSAGAVFIMSRGYGAAYVPNNSLIAPPPIQQ